ncbi:reticulophagy regulator 1 isoform X1 [Hyperolius riggenbachi]|uniref:reticulophagy regulator 1 isoform X1 n=1 Tax=Hyperolius riggenbachi TaxID=752182 RepID=UPI0035A28735
MSTMLAPGDREAREEQSPLASKLQRVSDTLSWQRPLHSLAIFICCHSLFWFLALTPWRVYHLLSLILLGVLMVQIVKHFLLSRSRGAQVWRGVVKRWEAMNSDSGCRSQPGQCMTESCMSCSTFLQELSHFKQKNPGKFCLLACSVCSFFVVLGSYIPGIVLSYFILLCAFLCPLLKCNEFGQKVYSKLKPVLQKLDFGLQSYVSQWMKAISKKDEKLSEEKSELDLSALCPQITPGTIVKELSVSDTEPSDLTWTENGTFNLSEGYTPQTDTSDDLDRPSDQEEAFVRGLSEFPSLENGSGSNDDDSSIGLPSMPKRKHKDSKKTSAENYSATALSLLVGNDQPFDLVSRVAGEVITAAVSAAVTEQLKSTLPSSQTPASSPIEDTDIEEVDDFELLDQSELEDIEEELGHASTPESEGKKSTTGFLSSLLGGH